MDIIFLGKLNVRFENTCMFIIRLFRCIVTSVAGQYNVLFSFRG